jgi:translation initiation factor 2 beta subunit (eIF-2beta)/eIF-5
MGMKIIESFIEITQEINGREPTLSKIFITANVQESVRLHNKTFYFCKTVPKFLTAEKIRLKKNQTVK